LLILVAVATITVGISVGLIAAPKVGSAMKQSKIDHLESITVGIKSEIENYFEGTIKPLIVSQADNLQTIGALRDFSRYFYELAKQSKVDIKTAQQELIKHYETKYLNSVNYDMPRSANKRDAKEYLPKDPNGIAAQKIFILDNPNPIGEKQKLRRVQSKYILFNNYARTYNKYHNHFSNLLDKFSLYDIFLIDSSIRKSVPFMIPTSSNKSLRRKSSFSSSDKVASRLIINVSTKSKAWVRSILVLSNATIFVRASRNCFSPEFEIPQSS
jgi:methyl-accepting chemotaxis protein